MDDPIFDNWHAIARSEDLAKGTVLGRRLLGEDLVLWRCEGKPVAWQDRCIHRGARLSLGWLKEDKLVCPYHGWIYDGMGHCVGVPTRSNQLSPLQLHLRSYQTHECYGLVWVNLGVSNQDVPVFPQWCNPSYRKILCGPYYYNSSSPRVVENFLTLAHFSLVHQGLLGKCQLPEIDNYEVESTLEGIIARTICFRKTASGEANRHVPIAYTYQVPKPFQAYFSKESQGHGLSIFLTVTPVEEEESISWMSIAMNYAHELPEAEVRAFQDRIVAQDIAIVESQRLEHLPVDWQAEWQLSRDRTAIAYRQWLKQLGIRFETVF